MKNDLLESTFSLQSYESCYLNQLEFIGRYQMEPRGSGVAGVVFAQNIALFTTVRLNI